MSYIKQRPTEATFTQKGLEGFLYSLDSKDLEIYFIDSTEGHDGYVKAKEITHIYYIIQGQGKFILNNEEKEVREGDVVEIPPNVEFTYKGEMKLVMIIAPPWKEEYIEIIKKD